MNPSSSRKGILIRQGILASLFIAVIVFAVYGDALRFGFVWDDQYLMNYDTRFHSIDIPRFFSDYFFRGEYYRPITFLSFAVDWALHGINPAGYHLTNLLLHVAVSLALFFFLNRVTENLYAALTGAVLFAVHPAHVENIAFISARGDMLAAFFVLLSLAAYVRFRTGSTAGSRAWLAASLAGYAAGLFSKEMAVTLPLIIIAYDILCVKKVGSLPLYALYGVVAAAYFVARYFAINELLGGAEGEELGRMIIPGVLLAYLRLFALLDVGDLIYVFSLPKSLFSLHFLAPVLMLMLVYCIVYFAGRKIPFLLFGMFFILIALLPVSNIIPLWPPMAARFAYLPSLGLSFCAAGLTSRLFQSKRIEMKIVYFAVAAIFIMVLAFVSSARLPAWKSNISLWEWALARHPESSMAGSNLAKSYYNAGMYSSAVPLFRKFLSGNSTNAPALKELGVCYMEMGEPDSAALIFRELVKYVPRPDHYSLLAGAYLALQDTLVAGQNLIRAVSGGTGDVAAYIALAGILVNKGLTDSADAVLNDLPDSTGLPEIFFAWGNNLLRQNQVKTALYFWRRAISTDSLFIPAYRNLASALAFLGENGKAEEYYGKIVTFDPDAADIYYHWARIKAANGQLDSARILAAEAVKKAADPMLGEKITALLKRLDEGK